MSETIVRMMAWIMVTSILAQSVMMIQAQEQVQLNCQSDMADPARCQNEPGLAAVTQQSPNRLAAILADSNEWTTNPDMSPSSFRHLEPADLEWLLNRVLESSAATSGLSSSTIQDSILGNSGESNGRKTQLLSLPMLSAITGQRYNGRRMGRAGQLKMANRFGKRDKLRISNRFGR